MKHVDIVEAFRTGAISKAQLLDRFRSIKSISSYGLSAGQRGLWALEKMAVGESGYNVPMCFRFEAGVDVELFRQACEFTWAQHPILRSVIVEVDGAPEQRIEPLVPAPFEHVDATSWAQDQVREYLREKTKEPFVLELGPLLRIVLLSRSRREYIALFVIHHILFDGSSAAIVLQSVLDAYIGLLRGERRTPAVLPGSYRDFVEWERQYLESEAGRRHRAYWLQQLAGALPTLEMPTDRSRAAHSRVIGRTYKRSLSKVWRDRVDVASTKIGVSLSAMLLGVYQLLLHRYSGESDLIVGMPTAGRPQSRFDTLVGYFVNMVALRVRIQPSQNFSEWIRSVQLALVEALDHAAYPFPNVVRDLRVQRENARSPIFQVAYEYQNASMAMSPGLLEEAIEGLHIGSVDDIHQEGEYEFVLEVQQKDTELALHFKYDAGLFDESTIARLADHFVNLLSQIVANPHRSLASYTVMTEEESQRLLVDWNATETK